MKEIMDNEVKHSYSNKETKWRDADMEQEDENLYSPKLGFETQSSAQKP